VVHSDDNAAACRRLYMKGKYFERIGWLGFVLIVSAYLFLTTRLLEPDAIAYHVMNLCGALCMAANAKHSGAKPLLWLNVVWAMVALLGLVRS
jgi:hypothetical protein